MPVFTFEGFLRFTAAILAMLVAGRVGGWIARRLNSLPVIGEILAGVVIGPSLVGQLFPSSNPLYVSDPVLNRSLMAVAGCAFLLSAGLEIRLRDVRRVLRSSLIVSLGGILVPFAIGLAFAWRWPAAAGFAGDSDPRVYAYFIATAMSISALPVIAKTLLDLRLYDTSFGATVISAATIDDVVGWMIFASLLRVIGRPTGLEHPVLVTVLLVVLFTVAALTLGRSAMDWLMARVGGRAAALAGTVALTAFFAWVTHGLGIHAFLGAFMAGAMLSDSRTLDPEARRMIARYAAGFFAPVFFVSVGTKLNLGANFDFGLTALIIAIACAGKVLGCGASARFAGLPFREALAIGFAMNSRGAMEIVLAMTALQAGLIRETVFVSLVIMAIVTSLLSGPVIRRLIGIAPMGAKG